VHQPHLSDPAFPTNCSSWVRADDNTCGGRAAGRVEQGRNGFRQVFGSFVFHAGNIPARGWGFASSRRHDETAPELRRRRKPLKKSGLVVNAVLVSS
jgi:hypothetical protein